MLVPDPLDIKHRANECTSHDGCKKLTKKDSEESYLVFVCSLFEKYIGNVNLIILQLL